MAFFLFLVILEFFFGNGKKGSGAKDLFIGFLIIGLVFVAEASFYRVLKTLGVDEPEHVMLRMIQTVFFPSCWDLILGVLNNHHVLKLIIFGGSLIVVPVLAIILGIAGGPLFTKMVGEKVIDKMFNNMKRPFMIIFAINMVVLVIRSVYYLLIILWEAS